MKFTTLFALAGAASAHTIFLSLDSNGVNSGISQGIRTPSYDGPITDVTSNSMACNGDPNPTTPTSKIIKVTGGSTVTAIWRHTLSSGPDDVMDASHVGPTMAYLKKVDNAATDSGIGNGWFKIQQDGLNNGVWGTSKVIKNGGKHDIVIPRCIKPGQYLLRAEMVALHSATTYPGAQFYMECAQIEITGSSGTKTPATTSFPGAYKVSDSLFPHRG